MSNPTAFLSQIKNAEGYRNYAAEARSCVKELYRLNHANQTLDFVRQKKAEYGRFDKAEMGIWEAMEFLNTLVDDSDPDIDLSQVDHALQTAEAIRQDGHPRWFILTGLIHDLGKALCLFGEQQWAVVGDTFPVGCAYSDRIVYSELFKDNPDYLNPVYQTPLGIYEEGCGLDNVHLSWGHDEYLYTVVKDYLPREALWMIRYHSCYPIHREGAYAHLLNEKDREVLQWIRAFNPYDLYSKCDVKPDLKELKPFYQELIEEFFPPRIAW
jgi:inositol oxygenase